MEKSFERLSEDPQTQARCGLLRTRHGEVRTPIFMPVGTRATVKGVLPQQLKGIGTQILLGNTYHLHLRPGDACIQELGGLHDFMRWNGPILTDSGGYQAFSLSQLRTVTDTGVVFRSHLDGQLVDLGPQACMQIQKNLGSDIAMVIDVCNPYPASYADCLEGDRRTLLWAEACKRVAQENGFLDAGHHLFGIVQGGTYADLRQRCAQALVELDFPGYAIGGVSVGEPESLMLEAVEASTQVLPQEKPRYVMGVGTPPQLLRMIALGADMFDCVMPSRLARHGNAFTPDGIINLKNACYTRDPRPLVEGLNNPAQAFSRAYLRHLFTTGELLSHVLLTLHNLHFFLDLMAQARFHIAQGDFLPWSQAWCQRYEGAA